MRLWIHTNLTPVERRRLTVMFARPVASWQEELRNTASEPIKMGSRLQAPYVINYWCCCMGGCAYTDAVNLPLAEQYCNWRTNAKPETRILSETWNAQILALTMATPAGMLHLQIWPVHGGKYSQ